MLSLVLVDSKVVITQNAYLPSRWVPWARYHHQKIRKINNFESQSKGIRIAWQNSSHRWAVVNSFQKLPRLLICWFHVCRLTNVIYPSKMCSLFFYPLFSPPFNLASKECFRGERKCSKVQKGGKFLKIIYTWYLSSSTQHWVWGRGIYFHCAAAQRASQMSASMSEVMCSRLEHGSIWLQRLGSFYLFF